MSPSLSASASALVTRSGIRARTIASAARGREARIQLGEGAFLGSNNTIRSRLVVGMGAGVNDRLTVIGDGSLTIGAYAAVGRELWVRTVNHDLNCTNMQVTLAAKVGAAEPTVADDVEIGPASWIGDRVTILAGARVGAGAAVAAGAVVPRVTIAPFTIWGGVPAKQIKARFADDVIDLLLEVAWWEWDLPRLKRNREFLAADLTSTSAERIRALIRI